MAYFLVFVLITLSGIFSGLNLGLLSLNKTDLERKIKLGNKDAKKVYPVRKNGNLLLVTLLIGNVAVNSAISIFLGSIVSGVIAGIISTALIVIFGEIIPQAVFSRHALKFGAKSVFLVRFFIFIFYPVCAPMAWALNRILGEEMPTIWSKDELREIVKLHEDSPHSDIDSDEERIILGALSFSHKTVEDVMTPRSVLFTLDSHTVLDKTTLEKIREKGFTRIPVYEKRIDNIIGLLYSKDLIGIPFGEEISKILRTNKLIRVSEGKKLDSLLSEFIKKKSHFAFVFNEYGGLEGAVTLEDIIEEVLRIEIVDENDTITDMQAEARKKLSEMELS
ncbi:MAG: hemolysin family protein [Candidatus Moranbacteria bacterium]|nr:hemolysin family protein [Candidatus Moranbacteria bacterium]